MRTVAALFVDPLGPYPQMPGVDSWDASRDARLYAGPHPIVEHPPCGPWGRLSKFSGHQDASLALDAVDKVRRWGGVLEHPLGSRLWAACGLPTPINDAHQVRLPGVGVDAWGGWSMLVEQVSWGHCCRKPTLLYLVRVDPAVVAAGWRTGGVHTHSIASKSRRGGLLAPSSAMRRRTPQAFAEWLVAMARSVKPCDP